MSRNSSAAEVKKKHLDTLGEELGSVYTALYNEVTWLHLQWDEYMELFGQKHRVKLLNNAASGFFRMIQSTLSDDVMIGIARLTDPIITHASKEKKYNLTILTLPNLMEPAEKEALEFLIKEAMDAAAFCRDWRNRRLAHRDLPLSLQKKNAAPLPPATVDKIEAALKGLAEVIRFIGFKRFDTDIRFDHIIRANGAERLLYVLNDGLKKHKERLDKMRSGIYDPKDHHERI